MVLNTRDGVQQILTTLTAIAQQLPSNGSTAFNVMHSSLGERAIYRSGMAASLSVPAGDLEALARAGHIRWMSRGIGVDTFVLVSSPPKAQHA
jgi:hypothetical protein